MGVVCKIQSSNFAACEYQPLQKEPNTVQMLSALISVVLGAITARLWYLEGYSIIVVAAVSLIACADAFILLNIGPSLDGGLVAWPMP